jgi:hypothetical protein
MSWRGFGSEWNPVLAVLAVLAVLCILATLKWWLAALGLAVLLVVATDRGLRGRLRR